MNIEVVLNETPDDPFTIKFKDLEVNKIYQTMDYPGPRFIVLDDSKKTILYVIEDTVEVAEFSLWKNDLFREVKEKVVITFDNRSDE